MNMQTIPRGINYLVITPLMIMHTEPEKRLTCPVMAVNKTTESVPRKASLLFSPAIQYTMIMNRVG